MTKRNIAIIGAGTGLTTASNFCSFNRIFFSVINIISEPDIWALKLVYRFMEWHQVTINNRCFI